jgi:cytoskeleton protein RodZ
MNGDHDFDLTIPAPHAMVSRGPAGVGAELRAVRERLGWKLPDIAARLRIRRVFLEAIEAGNLAALPAPTYAAGFIRSYAEAMGLDPEEILRRFRAEGMSRPRQPDLTFPQPVPDRAVPPGAVLLVVAVIGIAGYFFWYRHSEHELKMARMVPEVPAKLVPLAVPKSPPAPKAGTAPAAPPASSGTAPDQLAANGSAAAPAASDQTASSPIASNQPASNQPASDQIASGQSATATSTPVSPALTAAAPDQTAASTTAPAAGATSGATDSASATTANTAPASATPASAPVTSPGTGTASATPASGSATTTTTSAAANPLVISASANSWIEVRGPHGTILFSRVLKAGESWPVPNEPGLTMTTGNAGGTELVRNGTAGAPLGKPGAVLHNIELTPPSSGGAPATSAQ